MQFDIRTNTPQILAQLNDLQRKHLPAAFVDAANHTGSVMTNILRKDMEEKFDRPTPHILRGLMWLRATKDRPTVRIWINDAANKGIAPEKVLDAQIRGGGRRHKRFEKALISKGFMPSNMFAIPAYGAPKDAYGNVPGAYILRMLSDLQALGEQGYRANRKGERRGKRRFNYWFAIKQGDPSGMRPGIYWSSGATVPAMVFLFTRAPTYSKRFDFYGTGRRVFNRYAARHMTEALAKRVRLDNR